MNALTARMIRSVRIRGIQHIIASKSENENRLVGIANTRRRNSPTLVFKLSAKVYERLAIFKITSDIIEIIADAQKVIGIFFSFFVRKM